MVLRLILKEILKVYIRLTSIISSLMRSLEKSWKACNKIQIRVETLFVLYTKYLVTQNIWCVAHSVICVLQGLKEDKMNKVIQDGKYRASYPSAAFNKSIMN